MYNIELYELINKNSLDVVKQTFKISELEVNMKITLFVERKHFKKSFFYSCTEALVLLCVSNSILKATLNIFSAYIVKLDSYSIADGAVSTI